MEKHVWWISGDVLYEFSPSSSRVSTLDCGHSEKLVQFADELLKTDCNSWCCHYKPWSAGNVILQSYNIEKFIGVVFPKTWIIY